MLRRDADADAKKFDTAVEALGKQDLPPDKYKSIVAGLIHDLDNVRDGMKDVLAIAKPFAGDLVLEIKWAELDLKRIEDMRQVLATELNGEN